MDMEKQNGIIERGEIASTSADGYIVTSLDREGIETPPLKPVNRDETFEIGEKVYFFFFKDGTGRIICAV